MAYDSDTARAEMLETFYNLLPSIFPQVNPVSGSIFNSFVKSIADSEADFLVELHDFKDNLNVLTSTSAFIGEWENLVGLPNRPDLSLLSRQGRVFSRMEGTAPTVSNMKDLIRSYTGSDNFTIFEYHTLNDPLSAFVYEVRLTTPGFGGVDEEALREDLIRTQPAHCILLRIVDEWPIEEEIVSVTESSTATVQDIFVIGSSLIGGPDIIGRL
jgi:hypothetical protein